MAQFCVQQLFFSALVAPDIQSCI